MEYNKPPLTFERQADLLLSRGMIGDRSQVISCLASVNYYRLSGYWFPFRDQGSAGDLFKSGTTFDAVWMRYVFDRRLRLLMIDAIERIEVAVRGQLSYRHAHRYDAFAYAESPTSLPKMSPEKHREFLVKVEEEAARGKETFVKHFKNKYGDSHRYLPVWMASEIMAFGTMLSFYRGASHQVKQEVASAFGMPAVVFESWLLALGAIRNICAHHGRLWNREIGVKPLIPRAKEYPNWHIPREPRNDRVYFILTICHYCIDRVAPQSAWARRLKMLLIEFPGIPTEAMGFPPDWQAAPIWQKQINCG